MKSYNFCAGPATLPFEVYQEASQAVIDYNQSGLSILEISHRSDDFIQILEDSKNRVLQLMQLDANLYSVLFLQGGATMEFYRLSQNFLFPAYKAAYINTGVWSQKAIDAAKFSGSVIEIASSKNENYRYIPSDFDIYESYNYLHITSNNTIYGTQYQSFPDVDVPIVADMSSDIFSRSIDYSQFAMIYAGVQKNLSPAGMSLIVIEKQFLDRFSNILPPIIDYKQHIKNESMLNTPPVFPIYVSNLTMQWIQKQGGISKIEAKNNEKAKILYDEIDRNPLFFGHAEIKDRSKMNALFYLKNEEMSSIFEKLCQEASIKNLKGHRTSGGYRASMYNALDVEAVKILVEIMQSIEKYHG